MLSIRRRIGLAVFLSVAALQIALSGYVLGRVRAAHRNESEDNLCEQLAELAGLGSADEIARFIHTATEHNTKWHEEFFEVFAAESGERVAASANVPADGLGEPRSPRALPLYRSRSRLGLRNPIVWERPHPLSRKGHNTLRIAEASAGPWRIRAGESLKMHQKAYWALREQLGWGLLVISLLGSLGAWWVARRSLAPIQAMTERARQLGASAEGQLPRSGRDDELDRLADVLNEMLGRIRAEVQRVRRVGADAAHALRTPLAAIRGILEVHLQSASPEQGRDLVPALEVAEETIALVNRLLLLERLESSARPLAELRDVRLDEVAREVADALSVVADDRRLELATALEPAAIRGDLTQLRNALANLLDNALRHTPPGGRIELSVRTEGAQALVAVLDSGKGLRPDQLERVFERFYSDQDGKIGSGLGLAIARAVAEAHGGSLTASSPGGARFELRLPLARPELAPAA